MSQADKGALWQELKSAGVEFPNHYRDYSMQDLQRIQADMQKQSAPQLPDVQPPAHWGEQSQWDAPVPELPQFVEPTPAPAPAGPKFRTDIPTTTERDAQAGLRQNEDPNVPIRRDPDGKIWFQDEIRKAAFPTPRGRRVHDYTDTGFRTVTADLGNGVTESFEMPGDRTQRMQAKTTLPSHQVGIYLDPSFPDFRIHVYGDTRGFDFFDVHHFYGSVDLVPSSVKRMYVNNDLCYDMQSLIRAIEAEHRDLFLTKEPTR